MANDAHAHEHKHSVLPYVLTFLWLAMCTVATYSLAHKSLGRWSFIIAMTIAVAKGSAVVLFFMHLWDQKGGSRLTITIALLFVVLLISLTISDAVTRFPLALPPGSFRSLAPVAHE
jgi:caa(3)-type oxidase subunit IV